MATGISKTHFLEKEILNRYLRNTTAYTPVATLYVALQKADTLTALANSAQAVISMNVSPPVGATLIVGATLGTAETKAVLSVSGAGPFTVTLTTNLANSHASGEYVQINPLEIAGADTLSGILEVANSNSYARTSMAFGAPANQSGTGCQTSNSADVLFVAATGTWGLITHILIMDSVTYGAGNVLYYGALTTALAVVNSNQFKLASGQVTILED